MLVVAVDQMRRSEIDQAPASFHRRLPQAAERRARLDGHYGQENTYTGPGHALIMSGTYGYLNGIFQNNWFNRATGRSESMLFDEKSQVINQGTLDPGEDSSPRNFYGSTVGDELRMSNRGKSKVISLAGKERGSLRCRRPPAPPSSSAQSGDWTTSTYYMNALPPWLVGFNSKASQISRSVKSRLAAFPRRHMVPSLTARRGRPICWVSAGRFLTRSQVRSRGRPVSTGKPS